jgi:hypothetical protein
MLVTCYYDLYGTPDGFQKYLDLFKPLGLSGIPIVLFIDSVHASHFSIFPFTVKVIEMPLKEFELYQIAMRYDRDLPSTRNEAKDTKEFFALMNTKVECIKKAAEAFPFVTQWMWIDFGILKVVTYTERFINKLKELQSRPFTKMAFPGCWGFGRPFTVESINWRFCGGFFVMPTVHIERFYQHSKNVLTDFCTNSIYKLTWETNVWNLVEYFAEKDNINWYIADHNDTIVTNIDQIKS